MTHHNDKYDEMREQNATHYLAARVGYYRQPPICGHMTKCGLPCQNAKIPGVGLCDVHVKATVRKAVEHMSEYISHVMDGIREAFRDFAQSLQELSDAAQTIPSETRAKPLPVRYDSPTAELSRSLVRTGEQ